MNSIVKFTIMICGLRSCPYSFRGRVRVIQKISVRVRKVGFGSGSAEIFGSGSELGSA